MHRVKQKCSGSQYTRRYEVEGGTQGFTLVKLIYHFNPDLSPELLTVSLTQI